MSEKIVNEYEEYSHDQEYKNRTFQSPIRREPGDELDDCIALHCIVLYCTVLYCTVLYCIVLYCIVLYCFVLYASLMLVFTIVDIH